MSSMKASIDLLTAAAAREHELSAEALTDGNEEESAERLTKANGFAKAAKVLNHFRPAAEKALDILREDRQELVDLCHRLPVAGVLSDLVVEDYDAAIRALEEVSQ